jgi:hypothetical protein
MINDRNIRVFYRILNAWLAFIVVLAVFSFLPHWGEMSMLGWINEALYFLAFLLSLTIALKDRNNRDIFINIAVFFFFISFSYLNMFIGDKCLFGNEHLKYHVHVYKKILFSFLLNLTVVYIVLKHVLLRKNTVRVYLSAFGLAAAVLVLNFCPYILYPHHAFKLGAGYVSDLYGRIFLNDSVSVIFLLFFGYGLYRRDIALGEYINSLMSFLFVYCTTSLATILGTIYHINIPSMSQYFLTVSLVLLLVVLLKKLCFLCTEYGQFYESLLNGQIALGERFRIQRRRSKWNALTVKALKLYFAQRYQYFISFTGFLYAVWLVFRLPKFVALNFAVFGLSVAVLFLFVDALYKKRERQNHTLSGIAKADS